jgi:predicted HTH transcriptional regulator
MALIDDLTRQISTEVHRALDQVIRQAVEHYIVGNERPDDRMTLPSETSRGTKSRGKETRRSRSIKNREVRTRTIIDAVSQIGEASIEDVAELTGLDKRGVGSSLHYLAAAGKLKHAGGGKYKTARTARVA